MRTTVTMTSADSKTLEKTGVSTKWAVEASFESAELVTKGGISTDDSRHTAKQNDALNQFHKTSRSTKTYVLGGVPPADLEDIQGFSEWADTVDGRPMPVHYTLKSIAATFPFMCDQWTENESDPKESAIKTPTAQAKKRCKDLRDTFRVMFDLYQDRTLREKAVTEQAEFKKDQNEMKKAKDKILDRAKPIPDTFHQNGGVHPFGTPIMSQNKKYNVQMQGDGN